ncbi:MAG: DUF2484 family protein [Rhodobacteraceae bacterium]|nr:DUF2484 family protein [Paracoccaceae bacterium]
MSLSFAFGLLWMVLANVLGLIPSRDNHWRRAYFLIGIGIPLLVWITYENGVVAGLLCFAAAASILRWPLRYLWRWMRARTRRTAS